MTFNDKCGPVYFNICQRATKTSGTYFYVCHPTVLDLFYFSNSSNLFGRRIQVHCIPVYLSTRVVTRIGNGAEVHIAVDSDMHNIIDGCVSLEFK
jgi:hypothetical protein